MKRFVVLPNDKCDGPECYSFFGANTVVIKRESRGRLLLSVDGAIVSIEATETGLLTWRVVKAVVGECVEAGTI